jgi:hypothetical protein
VLRLLQPLKLLWPETLRCSREILIFK